MTLASWNYAPAGKTADTLGDMDYIELRGSGNESYSPGNSTANRILGCQWLVRPNFLMDLLGYSQLQGTTIQRTLPDIHPEIDNFYAVDAQVEGEGTLGMTDNRNAALYSYAKVTANYRPLDYLIKPDSQISTELDRYVTRSYGYSADYLTINGNMKFVTSGTVLSNPPGKVTGSRQLNYIWHQVPSKGYGNTSSSFQPPNNKAITNCLGKVNSVAFDANAGNYPAGTVLFIGVDPKMNTPQLNGTNRYWEITFNFLVRDNGAGLAGEEAGHNYIYDVPNARWDLVTSTGLVGGNRIYQTADLNTLFSIDA